ncbi:helix-turn-helix domain-containing protein [Gordonia sinesedis]
MADPCAPFNAAMDVLSRRWTGGIVRALLGGASRFGEIRDAVPGITDAVLSTRLRELNERRLVRRQVREGPPAQVRYTLTAAGRDLEPVLDAIEAYGRRHRRLLSGGR